MRGKHAVEFGVNLTARIIPAHAGQTCSCHWLMCACADHPRTCGANQYDHFYEPARHGSSPHMRGKHVPVEYPQLPQRIIPAHAGQTLPSSFSTLLNADHPRTCGANTALELLDLAQRGSSPHMRGKRAQRHRWRFQVRIIPAHAGQTGERRRDRLHQTDHPRTCGANDVLCFPHPDLRGSSPHMRGKRANEAAGEDVPRIIPAHAGQTSVRPSSRFRVADHPRTCGANTACACVLSNAAGSSPHMRGKPVGAPLADATGRIIPAHAGQTPAPCL